ncbi:MAG: hypothetical protein ACLFPL_02265 [Candidatus Nanoarchaeia archaeon]
MQSKKSISPIISTLLMSATVVIVAVGLFLFVDNFNQSTLRGVPTEELENSFATKVVGIVDNTLYLQTNLNNLNVTSVTLGEQECAGNLGVYSSKTLDLDISTCRDGPSKQRLLVEFDEAGVIILDVNVG